jgi:membrane-bound metal-dependent hydrolase YbcI (DUF457 family)
MIADVGCVAGVSLLTQLFYALVFITRYTDLFEESYAWNYFFKVFYLLSSFYTIAIMRFVYPRTREREVAWKLSAVILVGVAILSPFVMMIFVDSIRWSFREVCSPPFPPSFLTSEPPNANCPSTSGSSPKSSNPSPSSRSSSSCARRRSRPSSHPSTSSSWARTAGSTCSTGSRGSSTPT